MKQQTQADVDRVRAFRDAALADGWSMAPTYPGPNGEDVSRAATMEKDGFKMMLLMREPITDHPWTDHFEADISIWGPDRLCIEPPPTYSMGELRKGLRVCGECHKTDVDTERFSFAGRCCAECLPEARKKHEYPGWTN